MINEAKSVAIAAALEAGNYMKRQFLQPSFVHEKGNDGDLVTNVDFECERIILQHITATFPTHQIQSEEFGDNGYESEWLWLIDPLDGTNNFALDLPLFSVSISLMYKKKAVLSVIYEPMVDQLYCAIEGEGSYVNNEQFTMTRTEKELRQLSVAWIQGHHVQRTREAVLLRQHIDTYCKRMIRTWAPTLVWNMLAKGKLDGIVLYDSEGYDLYSGMLMVKEARGEIIDFDGRDVSQMLSRPKLIACHANKKSQMLQLVNEGLQSKEPIR
ncbi:inositol monophosphatase [Geomicrobium sp. JSM 1781026]|uniref:inositol monophosphatase family protein n=2 Tax=unclassified Geomicrobium TaxID=2628951 RepID=UPI0035C10668